MACAYDCKLKVLNEIIKIRSSLNYIVTLLNCENNLSLEDRDFIKFFETRGLLPAGFRVNTILFNQSERVNLFIHYVISNLADGEESDGSE